MPGQESETAPAVQNPAEPSVSRRSGKVSRRPGAGSPADICRPDRNRFHRKEEGEHAVRVCGFDENTDPERNDP